MDAPTIPAESTRPRAEVSAPGPEPTAPPGPTPGGSRELLTLALPLVVSQSFMTVQVFVDAILLGRHSPNDLAASFPAMMWYWLLFGLLQVSAGYVATFVAQYTGAGRSERVGPAVWQGVYFAAAAGLLFLVMVPAAPRLIALGGHEPELQVREVAYLQSLSFAALPMLIMAAVNGFFSGRGQTWVVLGVEVVGTAVNVAVAIVLIFGRWGIREMGIAGAGWATVAGSWVSALVALGLFLRPRYAREFATQAGWRYDPDLFGRLLRFGLPAGAQVFSDVLVFHVFTQLVGRLGVAPALAMALTVRLNMVAFLPMQGMTQSVSILVGQRLGGDRPDLAERSTYTGLRWVMGYMATVALAYLFFPQALIAPFASEHDPEGFAAAAKIVPPLLACAAVYSLADAVNMTFSFALRGAGDTRFVSVITFVLAWPLMVIPTWFLVRARGDLTWAWGFATIYLLAMSVCFTWRFRTGRWKTMRVIETEKTFAGI